MKLTIKDMVSFALLGTIMFISKLVMEFLPNIHLLSVLTMVYTLVYRWKALIPLYIYVMLQGAYAGFAPWWIPYLYIWTVLWAVTMLLPRTLTPKAAVGYSVVCALHGFSFGTLYAPAQVLISGLPWESLPAWILSGLSFDAVMGVGNAALSVLIVPLAKVLCRARREAQRNW